MRLFESAFRSSCDFGRRPEGHQIRPGPGVLGQCQLVWALLIQHLRFGCFVEGVPCR
jgi:hypothetical protein